MNDIVGQSLLCRSDQWLSMEDRCYDSPPALTPGHLVICGDIADGHEFMDRGCYWIKARGAAKYLTSHAIPGLYNYNDLIQNMTVLETEKSCTKWFSLKSRVHYFLEVWNQIELIFFVLLFSFSMKVEIWTPNKHSEMYKNM